MRQSIEDAYRVSFPKLGSEIVEKAPQFGHFCAIARASGGGAHGESGNDHLGDPLPGPAPESALQPVAPQCCVRCRPVPLTSSWPHCRPTAPCIKHCSTTWHRKTCLKLRGHGGGRSQLRWNRRRAWSTSAGRPPDCADATPARQPPRSGRVWSGWPVPSGRCGIATQA